jgi:hypothetical protein
MDKEEVFDETLEVAVGYAGSVGTALWSEIQEDRNKVCPGYTGDKPPCTEPVYA